MTIGKRLRELRVERGLTQQGLAAGVSGGLDYTYIGKIERDEQLPSLKILIRLGAALGVPLSCFFREEGPAGEILAADLSTLPGGEAGRELIRALQQLHPDDVRLVTDIVKVLSRHRTAGALPRPVEGGYLRAAEEEGHYGEEQGKQPFPGGKNSETNRPASSSGGRGRLKR